jgi:hypothetical protein
MDPFLEARGLWADFHDNFVVAIKGMLNASLPSRAKRGWASGCTWTL